MSQLARKYHNLRLNLNDIWNQTVFKKILEKKKFPH